MTTGHWLGSGSSGSGKDLQPDIGVASLVKSMSSVGIDLSPVSGSLSARGLLLSAPLVVVALVSGTWALWE